MSEKNSVFQSLEDQCTCWICFEIFKEPLTLSCSHTLCKGCAEKVLVRDGNCPFCRRSIDPPLPSVNPDVERLCQDYFETSKEMKDAEQNFWEEQNSWLLNIPFEIQVEILLKLPAKEAGRVAKVCKQLRSVTNDSWLWREFCQVEFPFCSVSKYGRNWKTAYISQSGIQKGWNAGKAGDFKMTALRGHTNYVSCFKSYKDIIVSGSADHSIKVWRTGNDGSPSKDLNGHNNLVHCLEFNESKIVSGAADKTVKIWDASRGDELHSIGTTENPTCLTFDHSTLIFGQNSPNFSIYDVRSATLIKALAPAVGSIVQVIKNGDNVYVGGNNGIRVYDVRKPAFAFRDWDLSTSAGFVVSGQKILTGTNGIAELDVSTGNRTNWDVNQLNPVQAQPLLHLYRPVPVTDAISLQSVGNHLAVLHTNRVDVYDIEKRLKLSSLKGDAGALHCMRLGTNKVVVGSEDNTIKVWELTNGKKLYNLIGGTLQKRANNPENPTKPGISGIEVTDSQIIASLASLIRVYDFDSYHPSDN